MFFIVTVDFVAPILSLQLFMYNRICLWLNLNQIKSQREKGFVGA